MERTRSETLKLFVVSDVGRRSTLLSLFLRSFELSVDTSVIGAAMGLDAASPGLAGLSFWCVSVWVRLDSTPYDKRVSIIRKP
jgi:hypothetical protein